jgi:hypothetical protein
MKRVPGDRPCTCRHLKKDHVEIRFTGSKPALLYCRICGDKPPNWCYNYTEIGNLEYLEWLNQ